MKNVLNIKTILLSLLIGAVAAAGIYVGLIIYIVLIFMAYCFAAFGPVCFGVSVAAALGSITALAGVESALYHALLFVPSAVILSFVLSGKCSYRTAVASCAFALAVGLYLNMFVPSFLKGLSVADAADAYIGEAVSIYSTSIQGVEEEVAQAVNEMVDMMKMYSLEITFANIVMTAMLFGFLQVVIAYALFRKKLNGLHKMAEFRKWELSNSFMWGCVTMLAAACIINATGVTYGGAVLMTVLFIVLLPLCVTGLSCTEFFIQIIPEGKGFRRVITYGLAIMCMPYCIFMFAIEGLADKLFKLRRRIVIIKRD